LPWDEMPDTPGVPRDHDARPSLDEWEHRLYTEQDPGPGGFGVAHLRGVWAVLASAGLRGPALSYERCHVGLPRQLTEIYGLHDVGFRRLNTPVNDVFRVTSSTGEFALKLYHRNRTAEAVEWEAGPGCLLACPWRVAIHLAP
jgi:hypothetical protein